MAMRDYISINNYSGLGEIGISRGSISAIASASIREVDGASLFEGKSPRRAAKSDRKRKDTSIGAFFSLPSGPKVIFTKEGKALIKMDVTIAQGVNVAEACEKIQSTVATAVTLMCDMVPFDVQVKVMRIV